MVNTSKHALPAYLPMVAQSEARISRPDGSNIVCITMLGFSFTAAFTASASPSLQACRNCRNRSSSPSWPRHHGQPHSVAYQHPCAPEPKLESLGGAVPAGIPPFFHDQVSQLPHRDFSSPASPPGVPPTRCHEDAESLPVLCEELSSSLPASLALP